MSGVGLQERGDVVKTTGLSCGMTADPWLLAESARVLVRCEVLASYTAVLCPQVHIQFVHEVTRT